jgi:hypothetical protein
MENIRENSRPKGPYSRIISMEAGPEGISFRKSGILGPLGPKYQRFSKEIGGLGRLWACLWASRENNTPTDKAHVGQVDSSFIFFAINRQRTETEMGPMPFLVLWPPVKCEEK